ncbi:hypothetical protein BH11GEM1_BH11GEM1_17770 [soil metagenome]
MSLNTMRISRPGVLVARMMRFAFAISVAAFVLDACAAPHDGAATKSTSTESATAASSPAAGGGSSARDAGTAHVSTDRQADAVESRSARWSLIADSVVRADACSSYSGDYEREGERLVLRLYHAVEDRSAGEHPCIVDVSDSLIVTVLDHREHVTTRCWTHGRRAELLVGLIEEPSSIDPVAELPRLVPHRAWRFDTLTHRVREAPTAAVRCEPELNPD